VATDSTRADQQEPEEDIERLAQEIGRLIRRVEPQRREELRELAYTLIREEMIETGGGEEAVAGSPPGPFNPLGTGILIFVLGAGLSFIFGPVGLLLMLGGMIFIVWGATISWIKR
jgi:hypothetical protein